MYTCTKCGNSYSEKNNRRLCENCLRPVNTRFGKLVTRKFERHNFSGNTHWYVLCDCDYGNQKWINWVGIKAQKLYPVVAPRQRQKHKTETERQNGSKY